jgi:phage shock protein A
MLDSVNTGVARVFINQSRIEKEAQKLENQTAKLNKQTASWIKMIEDFNESLKELGDLENWAQVIETDMKQVAMTLENVHRKHVGSNTPSQ